MFRCYSSLLPLGRRDVPSKDSSISSFYVCTKMTVLSFVLFHPELQAFGRVAVEATSTITGAFLVVLHIWHSASVLRSASCSDWALHLDIPSPPFGLYVSVVMIKNCDVKLLCRGADETVLWLLIIAVPFVVVRAPGVTSCLLSLILMNPLYKVIKGLSEKHCFSIS